MSFLILYAIYWAGPDAFEAVLNRIFPVIGFLFVASIAVMFYLACFKMDKILDAMSRSEVVTLRSPIKGQCFRSRYEALFIIWYVLTFRALALKRGHLDEHDYDNFPIGLRWLIKGSCSSIYFVFFYFILVEWIYESLSWVDWLLTTLDYLVWWMAEVRGGFYER